MPVVKKIVAGALSFAGVSTVVGSGLGIHSALQDKTISDKLITLGKDLITNQKVFEVAFKQHRDEAGFLQLINISNNAIDIDSLEKAGTALKNWCNEGYKILLTDERVSTILSQVEKYCVKPFRTIRERLDKMNKSLAKDWNARLKKISDWQSNQDLKKDLATANSSVEAQTVNETVWQIALMNWCNDKLNTQLVNDRNDSIFEKINSRCLDN